MKIRNLIDRSYSTVSILEDTRFIAKFLLERQYLVIIDQTAVPIGIVTIKDLFNNSGNGKLIDYNIDKPKAHPEQSITEVFMLMQDAQTDFLPVYENNYFIGAIALNSLTGKLATTVHATKENYQKAIHDLKNPIGNLRGLLDILNESITERGNQELIKLCDISCKNAMDILEDLLNDEIDECKPLKKVATEMNAFFKQCIDEQLGLSQLKEVRFVTELSKRELVKHIDQQQMRRAVQNVISNAIKFSHPNSVIKIGSMVGSDKLTLKISDTGIGIPKHLQPTVFQKFTPSQRAGTRGEPSTGLGLCFTKHCIEQHNGNIRFKTVEGKGTTFFITV